MATHCRILAKEIPCTQDHDRLQWGHKGVGPTEGLDSRCSGGGREGVTSAAKNPSAKHCPRHPRSAQVSLHNTLSKEAASTQTPVSPSILDRIAE